MKNLLSFLKVSGVFLWFTIIFDTETIAQSYFSKTYGTSGNEWAQCAKQTTDGGFIVAGYKGSAGAYDVYLVKLTQNGDTTWTKTYGGSDEDVAYDVEQTTDGGYVMAGYSKSFGGVIDFYVVKTNSNGDTMWTKTYGGASWEKAYSITQTKDGGYAIVGETLTYTNGATDIYVVKTDSLGDTTWTEHFGSTDYDYGYSIEQTTDNGYIIGGHTKNYGAQNYDLYLLKITSAGVYDWGKIFGGAWEDKGYYATQTSDGGYALAGYYINTNKDIYVVKTNSTGTVTWSYSYDESFEDIAYTIQQTSDGGYILGGYVNNVISVNSLDDLLLMKINASGVKEWAQYYGGNSADRGASAYITSNGGFISAGFTESMGAGSKDAYVVRTNSSGTLTSTSTCDSAVASFTSSGSGYDYNFTNTSLFDTLLLWDFGDGNTSAQTNPPHTYAIAGSYTVCLTASNGCSSDSTCQIINITCPIPVSNFTFTDSSLTVSFSNLSTDADSYLWNFGNSKTDTVNTPTHTYGNSGTFNVCLITTNSCGSDTVCKNVYVCQVDAQIIASASTICENGNITFDNSGAGIINFKYFKNDSLISTDSKVNHTFSAAGAYNMMLVGDDGTCNDTSIISINVTSNTLADFGYSSNDLVISFSDLSIDATGWNWDFGDGKTDTAINPIHTFGNSGTFNVCLITTNSCGNDTFCNNVYVCQVNAQIIASTSTICENGNITFDNSGAGIVNFKYFKNDSLISTDSKVNHVFNSTGAYNMMLVGDDGTCNDTSIITINVTGNSIADFGYSSNDLVLSFLDSSIDANNWNWDFGDGKTDNLQNPSHSYTDTGTYNVCLIAINSCSNDTICKSVKVSNSALCLIKASFNASDSIVCEGKTIDFISTSTGATLYKWMEDGIKFSSTADVTQIFINSGIVEINLIVTDGGICIDTASLMVTVNPKPLAFFSYIKSGLDVNFKDSSINANSLFWKFETGKTDTSLNPLYTFTDTGTYSVCLIVTNNCGTDTLCKNIDLTDTTGNGTYISKINSNKFNFEVYPNPTSGLVLLNVNRKNIESIIVYNILGVKVNTTEIYNPLNNSILINLSDQIDGIYFMVIKSSDSIEVQKMVIKR